MLKPGSQAARFLELLSDGEPHEIKEIHDVTGVGRPNSRASDLRRHGHVVEYWFEKDPRSRRRLNFYRLVSGPDLAGAARAAGASASDGVGRAPAGQAGGAGSSPAARSSSTPPPSVAAGPFPPGLSRRSAGEQVPNGELPQRPAEGLRAEEAGPVADGGSRDAQAGPAKQGPELSPAPTAPSGLGRDAQAGTALQVPDQLGLDEVVGVENELAALRSLGPLSDEDADRLDELASRHEQISGGVA